VHPALARLALITPWRASIDSDSSLAPPPALGCSRQRRICRLSRCSHPYLRFGPAAKTPATSPDALHRSFAKLLVHPLELFEPFVFCFQLPDVVGCGVQSAALNHA